MKRNQPIYSLDLRLFSLFLQVLLLWLAISLPVIADAQQKSASAACEKIKHTPPEKEEGSQAPGAPEEKTPLGTTLAEEFLHHHSDMQRDPSFPANRYLFYNTCLFAVFHGELFSPPPES